MKFAEALEVMKMGEAVTLPGLDGRLVLPEGDYTGLTPIQVQMRVVHVRDDGSQGPWFAQPALTQKRDDWAVVEVVTK